MHDLFHPEMPAVCRVAAAAALFAGVLLLLRRIVRGCRGTHPLVTREACAVLRARPWHPADAALLLLAILLPMAPALLALLHAAPAGAAPASSSLRAPAFAPYLLYYGLVLAGVVLAARRTRAGIGAALGITRDSLVPALRTGAELGLAALPPVMLVAWLTDWVARQVGAPVIRQPVFDLLADPGLASSVRAILLIIAVLVAPLAEEAVFRGVVLPSVLRNRSVPYALLLVNVLFALLHLHPPSFLPLLAIGVCFSLGMLATGSLLTPVVMHAILNAEMLLVFYALPAP